MVRFRYLLIAAVLGALVVSALPAVASQGAATFAQPGDTFRLGQGNVVNARTILRGSPANSNLLIMNNGSGIPLEIRTLGNGKAPLRVDSAVRVKNLNADRLDNRHANQLIRAAFGATDTAADADGDAVTATITAPLAGILVMSGSIEASGTTADVYSCSLTVGGAAVTGTLRVSEVDLPGGDHTANMEENCATDGAHVVAGGTHTVALKITGRDTVEFDAASVWVMWVPFDGTGSGVTP